MNRARNFLGKLKPNEAPVASASLDADVWHLLLDMEVLADLYEALPGTQRRQLNAATDIV